MKLWSESFAANRSIPTEFGFGKPSPTKPVELSHNRNPHFQWSDLPPETRSLALICHDSDVPSSGESVNQAGKTVPASLPRVNFYHWVLVDLSPIPSRIMAGEFSNSITPRGKKGPDGSRGTRSGINDYTSWFASDPEMKGNYFGYDGPCPPWNDEIIHHYHFTLYALSVNDFPLKGTFTGPEAVQAMAPFVLGKASLTGTYSINPKALLR